MEPVEVLRAFWTAMCDWERRAFQLRPSPQSAALDVAQVVAERTAIIAEYCTPKRRVSSESLTCGDPTVYDPAAEDVQEVVTESPHRVVIYTQRRAGFKERRKYVLLRRGDRWLLDRWQWLRGGKWDRGII